MSEDALEKSTSLQPAAGMSPATDLPVADGSSEVGTPAISEATLRNLARICERLGAAPDRSEQMARQLVKRAGQLACERDWSEAQALEHLLSLLLKASDNGGGSQSPQ